MTVPRIYFNIYIYMHLLFYLLPVGNTSFLSNIYTQLKVNPKLPKDAGSPLFITPYLESGAIELAQNLSRVSLTEKMGFRSHAGFFTIDKKYNSNMYFWYFPPFSKNENAPVMLWLQGGPGGSSLYGLFAELGPLIAKKDGFAIRQHHWAQNYHLIFIDNPVGTGFSFTDNDNGYCNDEACVGRGLYICMEQFFTMFPYLQGNDFYITGESYAGKYIPSLAITIHQENESSSKKINLVGMAIGNGYCDPVNQMDYGNYLYQHGLIDDVQQKIFLKYQNEIAIRINKQEWAQADILLDRLMDGELSNFSYFKAFTGFNYYYNFLQTDDDEDDLTIFMELLQNEDVRQSVHVGQQPFNTGDQEEYLKDPKFDEDLFLSAKSTALFEVVEHEKCPSDVVSCSLMNYLNRVSETHNRVHALGSLKRSTDHPDARAIFYEEKTYSKRKVLDFISVLNGFTAALKLVELFSNVDAELLTKITQLPHAVLPTGNNAPVCGRLKSILCTIILQFHIKPW